MRIPLFGTGTASGQKQVTVRKTVGMYWERRGETEKAPMVAVPWPHVEEVGSPIGSAGESVRCVELDTSGSVSMVVVCGKTVYRVDSAGIATSIGDITGPTSGQPRVAVGPDGNFLVVDGIGSWFWDGASYYALATPYKVCTWIGGYYVAATGLSGGQFAISSDGTTWVDVATAEAVPDRIVALAAMQNELVIFGETSTEVWSHTGDADFPFARINGATTNIGCMGPRTVAKVGGALVFVARSSGGMPFIARMNGYTPERISTDDIDRLIPDLYTAATALDAIGFVWRGHPMYMISTSSPPAWTLYYDAATSLWGHVTDGERHRIVLGCEYSGTVYGYAATSGSSASRQLYRFNRGGAGVTHNLPKRQIITDHVVSPDGERFTVDSLRLDMSTNVDADEKQVSLKVSRDGGLTWGASQSVGLGTTTGPQKKVEFRRLGRARSFTFDLSFPTDVPITVHSASLNAND